MSRARRLELTVGCLPTPEGEHIRESTFVLSHESHLPWLLRARLGEDSRQTVRPRVPLGRCDGSTHSIHLRPLQIYRCMGRSEASVRCTRVSQPNVEGHVLVRRCTQYTHAVEFTPLDSSFVRVRSWNAPPELRWPAADWILLSVMKLKKLPGRDLWKDMRSRGYWIWLGGKRIESCHV